MLKQKIQNLLIVVLAVVVVVLSSFLITGFNRMIVQARNDAAKANSERRPLAIGPVIGAKENVKTEIVYQGVYTDEIEISGDAQEAQGEKLQGAALGTAIGGQSTSSGIEFGTEFVPASAFRHDGFTGPANGYRYRPTAGYIHNNSSSDICLAAPVYLPDGVTLIEFSWYSLDNDPNFDLGQNPPDRVHLWRKDLASPSSSPVAVVSTFTTPGFQDIFVYRWFSPITGETVSNNYSYYITFCFAANTGLDALVYGFRVDYAPPCTPIGESDNIVDAITVTSGQSVCGRVNNSTDWDDVYKIQTVANQQLTISMNGSGGDADLYLYPPGTTDVNTDPWAARSQNTDNNEFIQFTVGQAGFWYIDVFSFSGTTSYNVTATLSGPGSTGVQTFDLAGITESSDRHQK